MPDATQQLTNTTAVTRSSTYHNNSQPVNMNGATMNPGGNGGGAPNSAITNNALPNPNIATKQGTSRMIVGPQVIGARPGSVPTGYTPNIGKDEVVSWFRNASSATRLDALCALLEACVPFEIRILGSVLEVLGKKEVTQLRTATDMANNVVNKGCTLDENRTALFASIKGTDDPPTPHASNTPLSSSTNSSSLSSSSTSSVVNNSQSHLNPNNSAKSATSHRLPLSSSGAQDTTNRPVPGHKTEQLRTIPVYEPPQLRQQVMARTHSPAVVNPPPQPQFVNGTASVGSRSNCSSEDETDATSSSDSKDLRVLQYESTRGKLIIYLALLKSTNTGAANVYYSLISQVDKTIGNSEWMERQSESVLEEVDLLYTLGIHHPAFTFEQRLMLSEILLKVRRELQRKKAQQAHALAQVYSSVQVYDPQYAQYYFQMPPPPPHLHSVPSHEHLGTPPPQQHPLPGSAGHPVMSLPPPGHMNYYQPLAFPLFQNMGASTHPQNPSYVNAAPIMSNVGHLGTAIRSTSPSNIPPLNLAKDVTATVPSAIKVEMIPPPLYEKIPPLPTERDDLRRDRDPLTQNVRSEKLYCFNCGKLGHLGPECETSTLQQVTHHLFGLNYEDNNNKNKSN